LKAKALLLPLLLTTLHADVITNIENSNFTVVQGSEDPINFNRLRLRSDYTNDSYFGTLILDHINYLGKKFTNEESLKTLNYAQADTVLEIQTGFNTHEYGTHFSKINRLYAGFEDDKNRIVVGLQNITMGVGRIWNPSNLFNPRNAFSLEPNEIYPVLAVNYNRHLSDTAKLMLVSSQKNDKSYKYASQLKGFYDGFDIGVNLISSDTTHMFASEFEGHLGETGVEVRAELVYLESDLLTLSSQIESTQLYQGIIGADYGFVNGFTLTAELLMNSHSFDAYTISNNSSSEIIQNMYQSHFYTALSGMYAFDLVLSGSIVYIESFADKNSRFISPTLNYALNDYNSFNFGAFLQFGADGSEYAMAENSYFIQYQLSF
jgi:hypothetical protein